MEAVNVGLVPAYGKISQGSNKSGRFWKAGRERFSSVKKGKSKMTLNRRNRIRDERKEIVALSASIKEEKKQRGEELRERRKKKREMKLENERKAEVVQVIKNTQKIKKMSKRQLKYIETRDTSKM